MDITEYYIKKIDNHYKIRLLNFFTIPKEPIVFSIIMFILFAAIEVMTFWIIPSMIVTYIVWECFVAIKTKHKILENCLVEEAYVKMEMENSEEFLLNFPDDNPTLTNEDRNQIIESQIDANINLNFLLKLKNYYKDLIFIVISYILFLSCISFLVI
jgi:hypothetical protein